MTAFEKYVFVLAHADGWGAQSANAVVRHLHEDHPDVGVILIVSRATRDAEGNILNKIADLAPMRELKETDLARYFEHVDALYDQNPDAEPFCENGLYTFAELARRYCADGIVHYTSTGGKKGGEEVAAIFAKLEQQHGIVPAVVLSSDTMARLPEEITERFHCFSTHPGPLLGSVKIEGMHGVLRSIVNKVFFDRESNYLSEDSLPPLAVVGGLPAYYGGEHPYLAGTLFLMRQELDGGPPVTMTLTPFYPQMCAYEATCQVFHSLTESMKLFMPVLLNAFAREALVELIMHEKKENEGQPVTIIPNLNEGEFEGWEENGCMGPVAVNDPGAGMNVLQNALVDPVFFKAQMRRLYPGPAEEFEAVFEEIFGARLEELAAQQEEHMTDWGRLTRGDGAPIRQIVFIDGEPYTAIISNPNEEQEWEPGFGPG